MLVIDGWAGKSRKLEEILKQKNCSKDNTLILDSVGIHSLIYYGDCYRLQNTTDILRFLLDYTQISNPFGIEIDRDNLKCIVLEVNCHRDMINTFKNAEELIKKELIITVQCPESECQNELRVYEI